MLEVKTMKIDVVIPIKTSIIDQAIKHTIPSVFSYIQYRKIYVITKSENFPHLQTAFGDRIGYLDEDKICEGLTLSTINNYFRKRNAGNNILKGWYLQQFLKFGLAKFDFISEYYLIWDGDAIILRPLTFFSTSGQVLHGADLSYHKLLFDVIDKLLHLKKQKEYSFISEHMVFKKEIVLKIMNEISNQVPSHWWLGILDSYNNDELANWAFSEYEMYGTYFTVYYPNLYKLRKLETDRVAVRYCTMYPTPFELKLLSWRYDFISLEISRISEIMTPFVYRRYRLLQHVFFQVPFMKMPFMKKIIWYIRLKQFIFRQKVKSEKHKLHKPYKFYSYIEKKYYLDIIIKIKIKIRRFLLKYLD